MTTGNAESYTLRAAKAEANRQALDALDDAPFYVCALPEQPRRYTVVPEADYSRLAQTGVIGRTVYAQNGRHARMEQETLS